MEALEIKYAQVSVVPSIQMIERECKHDGLGQRQELCPLAHTLRTRINVSPFSLQKELSSSFPDMPSKQHDCHFFIELGINQRTLCVLDNQGIDEL